jgi:hypothetical protein
MSGPVHHIAFQTKRLALGWPAGEADEGFPFACRGLVELPTRRFSVPRVTASSYIFQQVSGKFVARIAGQCRTYRGSVTLKSHTAIGALELRLMPIARLPA